jgi:hypothetical protein
MVRVQLNLIWGCAGSQPFPFSNAGSARMRTEESTSVIHLTVRDDPQGCRVNDSTSIRLRCDSRDHVVH